MKDICDRAHALATLFAQQRLSLLGTRALEEIDRRNGTGPLGSCASHEFLDANIVMESAFKEIYGESPLSNDGLSDLNAARWNAAWDHARTVGFIKLIDQARAKTSHRWRIVVTSPSGDRSAFCKGTFQSSEAALSWISRERLIERHPGCTLQVEPDILSVQPR